MWRLVARVVRSPGVSVTGSSELSVVGMETHTLKALQILNHGAISPAPTMRQLNYIYDCDSKII